MKLRGALCAAMFLIMGGCIFAEEEVPAPATAPSCESDAACEGGQTCCGGECVDLSSDAMNCGACGIACGEGEKCSAAGYCICAPSALDDAPGEIKLDAEVNEVVVAPFYDSARQAVMDSSRIIDIPSAGNLLLIERRGANQITIKALDAYGRPLDGLAPLLLQLQRPGGRANEQILRMEALPVPDGVVLVVHREIAALQSSLEAHVFSRLPAGQSFIKVSSSVAVSNQLVQGFGATLVDDRIVLGYTALDGSGLNAYLSVVPNLGINNAAWQRSGGYELKLSEGAASKSKMTVEVSPPSESGKSPFVALSWYDLSQSREHRYMLLSGELAQEQSKISVTNENLQSVLIQQLPRYLGPELMTQALSGREDDKWAIYGPRYGAELGSVEITRGDMALSVTSSQTDVLFSAGVVGLVSEVEMKTPKLLASWLQEARPQDQNTSRPLLGRPYYALTALVGPSDARQLSTQMFRQLFASQVSEDTVIVSAERPASNDAPRALVVFPIYKGERVCTPSADAMASN